jgi:hypothetical protein
MRSSTSNLRRSTVLEEEAYILIHAPLQDKEIRDGQVYLSLSFREQRFISSRVRCDTDPAFDGSFLLELGLQVS